MLKLLKKFFIKFHKFILLIINIITIVSINIMLSKNKERIENIDILRGIAIIFIVLYHYTAHYSPDYLFRSDNWTSDITKHLWVGVDIFLF